MTGSVEQINDAAQWIALQRNSYLEVVDPLEGHAGSFLDGLNVQTGVHHKAPPTMHSRCRLYREVPELPRRIGYLAIARSDIEFLEPLFNEIKVGTVITGRIERIQRLLTVGKFAVQLLYSWKDELVVQVD